MSLGHYNKTIVAAVGTILLAVIAALTDRAITADELTGLVILVFSTFGVFLVPNKPADPVPPTIRP